MTSHEETALNSPIVGTVPGFKDHVDESAVGPYGILAYTELETMPVMRKPDFMLHPHKYFGEKSAKDPSKRQQGREIGLSDSNTAQSIREARQSKINNSVCRKRFAF